MSMHRVTSSLSETASSGAAFHRRRWVRPAAYIRADQTRDEASLEDTDRVGRHISEGSPAVSVSSNQIDGRVNAPDVAAKKHIATGNDLGPATERNRELESPNNGTEQDRKQESLVCSSGTGKSDSAMVTTQVEGGASAPEPTHRVHANSTIDELATANPRTNTSTGGSASRVLTSIREIQPPIAPRNRQGEMG